ncbi:MAG: hypothetical protein MHPSP_002684, partial [Paramarteilia canceri]
FRAKGSTLEECFQSCVLAISDLMSEGSKIQKNYSTAVNITAKSMDELLFTFLEGFIFLMGSEPYFICHSLKNCKIYKDSNGTFFLETTLVGDYFNFEKYSSGTEVKAPSFHQMSFSKDNS